MNLLLASLVLFCFALPVAQAGERVSVQLIWKHQFEFAAFYAAQEQGYYRDAGLEVAIREGGPGIDGVKEVLEGRADFGVGTSALVVERHKGKPVVVLAALMQHSPIALLARRKNGVASVLDLAGKPVAVDAHSHDEIEAYLRASGMPAAQIKLIEQTDWTLVSLDQGREAAKAVYVSNEPFLIRGREHEYLLLTPRSAGIDLFGNVLFSHEAFVKRRPETVKAFREATLKGLVYALAHSGKVSDLILARYNTQGKSRAHLLFEAEQIRELTRPDIVEPGYMSVGRWHHVVEVYASQHKMPADFDLAGFLYDPAPPQIPAWVRWALAAALTGMLAALAVVVRARAYNRKLQREINERKQAETALQASEAKYRNRLEEQVEARTVELVAARREAEQLARVKSEFLANMSHEIRTPLNGVLGFAQVGLRASDGRGKSQEYFARIIDSGRLLLVVINDILDFSKLDAGQLKVEARPYVLEKVLRESLGLLRERAEAKGLALTLEISPGLPAQCVGDALRLQQVLLNLLSNAVKFTEHGEVALHASVATHREGEQLVFALRDSGIGISPEQQARLFTAFSQADTSTTRRYGGTGLGLAISKRLVELMGGGISLDSQAGVGSTFRVHLPCLRPSLPTPAPAVPGAGATAPTAPAPQLAGLRLLVAEDNEVNQMLLRELLGDEGCTLSLAVDGQQAVDAVRQAGPGAYDLVLMDVQMPVMNGLEATRAIHAIDPGLPVVGQTGHALAEEREKCLLAGMIETLSKPLDPDQLVETIRKWARRGRP